MIRVYQDADASWYGVALFYTYPKGLSVQTTEPCYNRATAEYLGRKLLAGMKRQADEQAPEGYPEGPPAGYL